MDNIEIKALLIRVRDENIKHMFSHFMYLAVATLVTVTFIYYFINESINIIMVGICLISFILAIKYLIVFFKKMYVVFKPENSFIIKKYGGAEELCRILDEIKKTVIYCDGNLVISENYISHTKNIDMITKCDEVVDIKKIIHKTNFIVDRYYITIKDKYGYEYSYPYKVSESDLCDMLIILLCSKCKESMLG